MPDSLAAKAIDALKDLLVSSALEPGGCYTEAAISDRLGLGKTPVREALTLLVNRGWLKPTKGRGYEVRPLTREAVRDLFATRQLLEPAAARLGAGRFSDDQAAQLLALCAPYGDFSTVEGRLDFTKRNRDVHIGIVASADNPVLTGVVTQLLERTDQLAFVALAIGEWEVGARDPHTEIVKAMAAGDGVLAEALLADHILEAEQAAYVALDHERLAHSV